MIAILEKYEHNQDFHQIVDFVEASYIRYALTFNPTVYISYSRQFWSTARIETTEEGTKILATVDGKLRTVSESSIRINLKLNDEAGLSSLPDAELFENLQLMGYNILPNQKITFQKGQFSHQWKYLIHTIMHYTRRARIAQSFSLLPVADEPASPIGDDSQGEARPTDSALAADQDRAEPDTGHTYRLQIEGQVYWLSDKEGCQSYHDNVMDQQLSLLNLHPVWISPPLEFEAQELEINSLKARIKLLEDKDKGVVEQSRDDAPIKGRSLDEGEEEAERISDDTEEIATVLTSMDATSILTSGGVQVVPTAAKVATATVSIPTGSGVVSTASPIIPTAAPIFTTATESTLYIRRKGKEKMVESDTPKKKKLQEQIDVQVARELEEKTAREDQRMSEQIARDAEVTRIHAEEELQMMINSLDRSNETVVKYLQEYEQIPEDLSIRERIELISDLVKYQEKYVQVLKYQTLQRKPRSKKQKKDYYMAIEDFIPMGSKEEAERFKRKGLRFEQESVKKLKTLEEVPEEVKSFEEVSEEKVKEMMQLVPIEEVYVEALQVKHPIIDWKHLDREDLNQLWELVKETLSIRPATSDKEMEIWVKLKRLVHHVTSKDKEIFMLVEKDYPLKKGLAIVMISYKLQVENYSQMANDLILKIYKIASSLRQQDD
nr:hypothetical protein [Tanacetum cinerariifolium]